MSDEIKDKEKTENNKTEEVTNKHDVYTDVHRHDDLLEKELEFMLARKKIPQGVMDDFKSKTLDLIGPIYPDGEYKCLDQYNNDLVGYLTSQYSDEINLETAQDIASIKIRGRKVGRKLIANRVKVFHKELLRLVEELNQDMTDKDKADIEDWIGILYEHDVAEVYRVLSQP